MVDDEGILSGRAIAILRRADRRAEFSSVRDSVRLFKVRTSYHITPQSFHHSSRFPPPALTGH